MNRRMDRYRNIFNLHLASRQFAIFKLVLYLILNVIDVHTGRTHDLYSLWCASTFINMKLWP